MAQLRKQRSKHTNQQQDFPPKITDEIKKICIEEFRNALSAKTLTSNPCAICGIDSTKTKEFDIAMLPNKFLLQPLEGETVLPGFPQDISSMTEEITSLPHDINNLCEHLKVVFVGSKKPTKRQLLNILEVRRSKVIGALNWLRINHSEYKHILINDDMLYKIPVKKIPECIWETMIYDNNTKSEEAMNSNYTNSSIDDLLKTPCHDSKDEVLIEDSGIIDVDGTTISSIEQTKAAVDHLINEDTKQFKRTKDTPTHKIYVVPHGPNPVVEYSNPKLWTSAYPWLFPYGKGGPEGDRKVPLSIKAWVKHLIQLRRATFREDQMFLFHIFNVIQKREVSLQASICVRQPRFTEASKTINTINSEQLERSLCSLADGKLNDPDVKMLMSKIHVVGAKVPGTAYARRVCRLEIQANMMKFGMPAYWITLNPADVHAPIVAFLSGYDIDIDQQFPDLPSTHERAKIVAKNAVSCAKYFDIMMKVERCCRMNMRVAPTGCTSC